MIDLSEITYDDDLAQLVTIIRSPVAFVAGGVKAQPFEIPAMGIIAVAGSKTLDMIPAGDRITGAEYLITATRVYTTTADPSQQAPQGLVSDKLRWRNHIYSVDSVAPWGDFGFWLAAMLRIEGA